MQEVKDNLSFFFSKHPVFFYKKHEVILRADDDQRGIYCIKKGYARMYAVSPEGQELTLIIFRPGDMFQLSWVFNNIHNSYYIEAMTPVELWRVTKGEFTEFIKEHGSELNYLISRILIRNEGLLNRMQNLVFGSAHVQVAGILAICAERFGEKQGRSIFIQVPLTHKDIANLIGMARETVSIEMKKLEKKRIILHNKRGSLVILSLKKLKEESLLGSSL